MLYPDRSRSDHRRDAESTGQRINLITRGSAEPHVMRFPGYWRETRWLESWLGCPDASGPFETLFV
jgi:hypothetical protein